MKRDNILIGVSILCLLASGAILYFVFMPASFSGGPTPVPGVTPGKTTVGSGLVPQITRSLKTLEPDGALDTLVKNQQYQQLSAEALVPIDIGQTGRVNPFTPLKFTTPDVQQ